MPRRPLAVAGFAAFAGAAAAAWLGPAVSQTLALAAGVLAFPALLLLLRGKGRARTRAGACLLCCLVWALVCGRYCYAWQTQVEPVQSLAGTESEVSVQILDYPEYRYRRYYYEALVRTVDGKKVEAFPIRLSCGEPLYCQPYELVKAQAVFYIFQEGGLYSTRNTQLARGHVLGAWLSGYNTETSSWWVYSPGRLMAWLREAVGRSVSRLLPAEEAGLVRAILLGQRSGLSNSVRDDFAQIGSSHVMAVSGLHVSILAAFTALLVRRFPIGPWGRSLFGMAFLLLYLCLIGFPVSALRSGLMYFLYLLAQPLGRRSDGLTSLGFALLVICLLQPFSGGDPGFALSASSTAGILVLYRPVQRLFGRVLAPHPRLRRALKPARASVAVTVSALLFSLPIQLELFGGVSLLVLLSNLLLVPLVTLLLYLSIPLAALAPFALTQSLARPFAFCAGWLARLILRLAEGLASVPGGFVSFDSGIWLAGLAGAALIGCWAALTTCRRRGRAVCLGLLLIAGMVFWQDRVLHSGTVTLAMGGDSVSACVLVIKDGHAGALSLGGFPSGRAKRLLARAHISRLDSLYLPVRDSAAREMAGDLLASRPVQRLLLPQGAYAGKDLESANIPIHRAPTGTGWEVVPGVAAWRPSEEWLVLQANGRQIALHVAEDCALSISKAGLPLSAGQQTVLFSTEDAPAAETFGELPEGEYIPLYGKSLLVHIAPNGTIRWELCT